jgi:hypothetical protein
MASKLKLLKKKKAEEGEHIGLLLPANWIELKGRFSPDDLRIIADAVENNYKAINNKEEKRQEKKPTLKKVGRPKKK